MSNNNQSRRGEVPCPRNGACGKGQHHQALGDQYRSCLVAASAGPRGDFGDGGAGVLRASAAPPSAASSHDLTAGVSPDTLIKVVGRHREGWMDEYRNASYAISRAIVDGDIASDQIESYPIGGGDRKAARALAEAAGLDWEDPYDTDHVDHSVDALRQLMTGDTGNARVWLWEESRAPDDYGLSAHQISAATLALESIDDAAQLIVDADELAEATGQTPAATAKTNVSTEYLITSYSLDNPGQALLISRTGDLEAARLHAKGVGEINGHFATVTKVESVTVITEVDVTQGDEDAQREAQVEAYAGALFSRQNPGIDFADEPFEHRAAYYQSARMVLTP